MQIRNLWPRNRTEFETIARTLASRLQAGDVVALSGALGAGKTTFIAAAVRELQRSEVTSSPTFLFWQRYPGPPAIEHLDFYRIESPQDATELGLHEAFESGNIVFVEWPERLPVLLPPTIIRVEIEGSGDEPRTVTIETP
ncbi:MAG: tRNA (adenosine(37)-N6)-threonylcarbamoyltransferase complex ATPase subunit type 1 TsaE [Candidatus Eremiobacteraeota bacterium]|nr:tRNA (adenosine(37)-N6)-threonylcarbamoyltransferase complex ATPase subunit type 1 TsaE [Candidatus Eremiobacteraeota bacterium]MBC5801942.1 tRNA (adenosine(37)-N6)-threonylcarbamoyltransferase complex ATPase subunit type 1 TsaE [Candidatus Eremiobacteraeota bacterium]MBC5821668.1 tRNA (adenosine(37)-N6)-threonylcarbamoyltransferase complex ATPase subunit type 1 TsaE [Candidatus Eremiobacteraeota bacterium]